MKLPARKKKHEMLTFYIINESTDPQITHPILVQIATALAHQQVDFGSWWQTSPIGVTVAASAAHAPADACLVVIRDELGVEGALGYHDVDAVGRPRCFIGWGVIKNNGGTLTRGSNSLSAVLSHELCEAAADPYADWWADMPDGVNEIALEVCDPVESDSYTVEGVAVSNFVGPRYFSAEGPAVAQGYDRMGILKGPMTMSPNGYQILREGGPAGEVKSVWGEKFPEWKKSSKGFRRMVMPDGRIQALSKHAIAFVPPLSNVGDYANSGAHVSRPGLGGEVQPFPAALQAPDAFGVLPPDFEVLPLEPPKPAHESQMGPEALTSAATPRAKAETMRPPPLPATVAPAVKGKK